MENLNSKFLFILTVKCILWFLILCGEVKKAQQLMIVFQCRIPVFIITDF